MKYATMRTYGRGTCARCRRRDTAVFWHPTPGAFFCTICLGKP